MPKKKIRYLEKPWIRDPKVVQRFQELIDQGKEKPPVKDPEPTGGWQLWDWKTLEDKPQD
jgi:hypothetical protein